MKTILPKLQLKENVNYHLKQMFYEIKVDIYYCGSLSTDWVDCGGAHEILGIPASLCLRGWVVGGFMGWVGGVLVRGGWVVVGLGVL